VIGPGLVIELSRRLKHLEDLIGLGAIRSNTGYDTVTVTGLDPVKVIVDQTE